MNIEKFLYASVMVRVVNQDGEPWWVAKDICDVLGLKNPTTSLKALDDDEKTNLRRTELGLNPGRPMVLVNEPGLYALIFQSRKPEARAFKRWITHKVIPTIRKTGGTYMTDDALQRTLTDPDYLIGVLTAMKELKERLSDTQEERDHAVATKAWINDKKVASAMGTASAAVREAKRLRTKYENPEFMTVSAIPWIKQFFGKLTRHLTLLIGQDLKKISDQYSLPYHKVPGERYPITQWHRDAIAIWKANVERRDLRPKLAVYLR